MTIKNFGEFVRETATIGTIKGDLKRFDGKLRQKTLYDQIGKSYNLWWSDDEDVCKSFARLFSGKFAIDLGGYGPSSNDIFLTTKETLEGGNVHCVVVKTNGDDIIPDEVVIQAASLLRKKFLPKEEDRCEIVVCGKDFVNSKNGKITVDEVNSNYVIFTPGNVRIV